MGGDIKSPDWSNEQSNEMDPKADRADPVKMSKKRRLAITCVGLILNQGIPS